MDADGNRGQAAARPENVGASSLAQHTVAVAGSLAGGQVLGYALNLVAARVLGPDGFGAFAAMLSLILVGNVLALGVQTAGARRLVLLAPPGAPGAGRYVLRLAAFGGIAVACAVLVITPALIPLVHLEGPAATVLVAAALIPLTVIGGELAVAQGRERFTRLGVVLLAQGVGKGVGGIVGVLALGSLAGALGGFAIGSWLGAALGWVAVRPLTAGRVAPLAGLPREIGHATHALLALFVLTSIDVILARALLPEDLAGEYAVGGIVAKIAFWLPQFVPVLAFPRMADARRGGTAVKGAGIVAAIGAVVVLGCVAFGGPVVAIVGGRQYADLAPYVWLFAAVGAVFALAQFLLMSRLAIDDRRAVLAVWSAVVALVLLATLVFPHTVGGLVLSPLLSGLALVGVGVRSLVRERRRPGQASIPSTPA